MGGVRFFDGVLVRVEVGCLVMLIRTDLSACSQQDLARDTASCLASSPSFAFIVVRPRHDHQVAATSVTNVHAYVRAYVHVACRFLKARPRTCINEFAPSLRPSCLHTELNQERQSSLFRRMPIVPRLSGESRTQTTNLPHPIPRANLVERTYHDDSIVSAIIK